MILDVFNLKKHYQKLKNYINDKIDYYNSFTILLFSDRVDAKQKKIRVNLKKLSLWFFAYTFLVMFAISLVYYFTPLKYILFFNEDFFEYQNQQIILLNKKVIFLTKELEELVSTNKKLKYLEIMADSISADSLAAKKHEIIKKKKNVFGGDLFYIFEYFTNNELSSNNNDNIFIKPTTGFITRNFDINLGHYGIDFSLKNGTPIVASESGVIIFSNYSVDDGNCIMILHRNNYITVYKHLSMLIKTKGAKVKKGEIIGRIGDSGLTADGPHLHFEILKNGKPIDPLTVLVR